MFGTVANFHEVQTKMTAKQRERVAMTLISATVHNLGDKVWLSGLSDLVNAIDEPERFWDAYAKRLAGSAVPTGSAHLAREVDPVLREADTMLEAMQARIPYASRSLAPRRTVLGREMVDEGGVGPDLISPLFRTTRRNDPVPNALLDAGIGLTRHPSTATIPEELREPDGKDKLALNRSQRSALDGMIGDIARPQLNALISSADWQEMTSKQRKAQVGEIITDARKGARNALLPGFLGRGAAAPKAMSPAYAGAPDPFGVLGDPVN